MATTLNGSPSAKPVADERLLPTAPCTTNLRVMVATAWNQPCTKGWGNPSHLDRKAMGNLGNVLKHLTMSVMSPLASTPSKWRISNCWAICHHTCLAETWGLLPYWELGAMVSRYCKHWRARMLAHVLYSTLSTHIGRKSWGREAVSFFSIRAMRPTNAEGCHGIMPWSSKLMWSTNCWAWTRGMRSRSIRVIPSGPHAVVVFLAWTAFNQLSTVMGGRCNELSGRGTCSWIWAT